MTQSSTENHACDTSATAERLEIEPMDPNVGSIQPGGGICMRIELGWGRLRRCCLKILRRGYVRRMAETRRGDPDGCPHEVLDPRDIKFHRNVVDCSWDPADDPFTWRDRIPLARAGLAELIIMGGTCLALTILAAWLFWPVAFLPAALGLFFVWFFRNPRRVIPQNEGFVVSPADGKVVEIEEIPHDDYIGGPAVKIGVFLSIFNVHINRSPVAARVIGLAYRRGKFLNAMRPESAKENEQMAVRLEEDDPPHRRLIVRQITGAIARRIVCWISPGEDLERGEQFGMIKLGSRTELVLPREPGLVIDVHVGNRVRAGKTVMARYGVGPENVSSTT